LGEAGLDIDGLTEQTDPTAADDFVAIYDDGLAANRKVLLENLPPPAGNAAILFSQTADKTVANTVTPTDLLSTGVGSVTLPAGLLTAGMVIRLSAMGHFSTTGAPTIDIALNLGGTELCSTSPKTLGANLTAAGWRVWADIVCRSTGVSGTVVASAIFRNGPTQHWGLVKTTTTTVDTTGTLALTLPAEWGTMDAANTITCQMAIIERFGVNGL
jgi:acyl dehydratase